ncbi:hypothetical protein [Saccharopolyspora phatthalungensis]|uniref:hypothetical protein n=1 Tax=Saccharopolyspora phatthalungensis TaxID=664693 RepID=UPI000AF64220|nr:hypothetical protein [Saccharopolyspora phatthalungensis]
MEFTISTRTAVLDGEAVAYLGILITRTLHGRPVAEEWLPVGEDPTEADDEHAIQRLHAALCWQHGADSNEMRPGAA